MATRGLYVFKHDSEFGNAHAHDLFDRLTVQRKPDIDVSRIFSDYTVRFDGQEISAGTTMQATPGTSLIRRC